MALTVSILKNDLVSAFNSMTNGNDRVFSEKISAAVKKYGESGDIATDDKGTVSVGPFTGTGKGKIKLDDSICEAIIYAACVNMSKIDREGDEYLAAEMARGIDTMIAKGEVKTDVTGTAISSSGSSVPLSGTAKGTMTGVPAPMEAAFLSAYRSMGGMNSGGDDYMAQQVSAAVDSYLKAAEENTKGEGALSGSAGKGKMT